MILEPFNALWNALTARTHASNLPLPESLALEQDMRRREAARLSIDLDTRVLSKHSTPPRQPQGAVPAEHPPRTYTIRGAQQRPAGVSSATWNAFIENVQDTFNTVSARPHEGQNASYISALDRVPDRFGASIVFHPEVGPPMQIAIGQAPLRTMQSTSKPLQLAATLAARPDLPHLAALPANDVPFNEPATLGNYHDLAARSAAMRLRSAQTSQQLIEALQRTPANVPSDRMRNFGAIRTVAEAPTMVMTQGGQALDMGPLGREFHFRKLVQRMAADGTDRHARIRFDANVFASELNDSSGNLAYARAALDALGSTEDSPAGRQGAAKDAFVQAQGIYAAYISNCATSTDINTLTRMYATLTNRGRNPFTGDQVLTTEQAALVLDQMKAAGLYEASQATSERLHAAFKSGVSGPILACPDHQCFTIGASSTRLHPDGNSVRALAFLEQVLHSPATHAVVGEMQAYQAQSHADAHASLASDSAVPTRSTPEPSGTGHPSRATSSAHAPGFSSLVSGTPPSQASQSLPPPEPPHQPYPPARRSLR